MRKKYHQKKMKSQNKTGHELIFVNTTETVKQTVKHEESMKAIRKQLQRRGIMVKKLRFRKNIHFNGFMENYFQFKARCGHGESSTAVFKSIELEMDYKRTIQDMTTDTKSEKSNTTKEDWHGLLPLVNIDEIMKEWEALVSKSPQH